MTSYVIVIENSEKHRAIVGNTAGHSIYHKGRAEAFADGYRQANPALTVEVVAVEPCDLDLTRITPEIVERWQANQSSG